MLDKVKLALRISNHAYNDEIFSLIDSCRADLFLGGISSEKANSDDVLIERAIIVYCKANFGLNNPDSEKFQKSYEMLKTSLCLAGDYT